MRGVFFFLSGYCLVFPIVVSWDSTPPVQAADSQTKAKLQTVRDSEDAKIIVAWLLGGNDRGAFAAGFGDNKVLSDAKDLVLYTDVWDVEFPKGVRVVPYDFVKARMDRIRRGGKSSPAILVAKSVLEDSNEGNERQAKVVRKKMKNERYYYVEVAIGNLAWHWMKIAVGESEGKIKAQILWRKTS